MKNIEDVSGFGAISFYVAAEPFVELVGESKCLVCVELEVLGGLAGASVFFHSIPHYSYFHTVLLD